MMVEDKPEETHSNVAASKMNLDSEVSKTDEPKKGEIMIEKVNKLEEEPKKLVEEVSKLKEEPKKVVEEVNKLNEEPKKGEMVVEEVKKLEEKPMIQQVVVEEKKKEKEEPTIQQEVVVEEKKKEKEEPTIQQKVVEEKKKEKEEPTIQQVVIEEKKKEKEEPTIQQVVMEEKKKEKEEPTIQQVVKDEKKGDLENANVKKEKDVEKVETREILAEDVKEEKKVLEEPQTKKLEKDEQFAEEAKIGGEPEGKIKEQEPNKTDIAVVEQKNIQEESKIMEEPAQTARDMATQEEKIKQDVESDSSLLEKSSSFKEMNKFGSDLKEHEKKALNEFKSKIEEAILENNFLIKKNDEKLAPKPIEEEKVKSINEETKTSTEVVASEENETTIEVEKEEIHTKEKEVKVENDQEKEEKENREDKCLPNVQCDKIPSVASIEEKFIEIALDGRDISLWGVPLLPSKGSEATNVLLLKFLRAKDFKVNEAFEMLRNTIQWRKEFKIDSILDEDFDPELNSVAYMDGLDLEGHPICYNMYGIFEDNELYQKTFGNEEKRQQFLRWRFQLMEKGIQKLNFTSGGVTSLLQINDLKNSPGPSKKELRMAMKQGVADLQDNYPEFVARNIFVNVPFWYYAFNAVLSPFLTQRTKSKFVFARPSKVTETLLRYIPAEQVPIRYGGLKRENDSEFMTDEESVVTELAIKAGATETIEIPAPEVGTTILWDLTVLGWEVNYKAEFAPNDEGSYTIIVQKVKKMGLNEEPIRNSFKSNEPGKIILTIENGAYKKKRVFYRFKTHN